MTTSELDQKLWKYLFPVVERNVFLETEDKKIVPAIGYKGIAREDTGKLIAIQKDSYKVVSNAEVIMPLMEQLANIDNKYYIDPSHSFVTDQKMRVQITFPDLVFSDGKSNIALSLFIHNSYDSSEKINIYIGALRFVCGNGLILGTLFGKYIKKHTRNIDLDNIQLLLDKAAENIPTIKQRIEVLQNLEVKKEMLEKVKDDFGKRISNYISEQTFPANQYILLNYITWYISHEIDKRLRASYQIRASRMFQL